jgi:hypothetical protein
MPFIKLILLNMQVIYSLQAHYFKKDVNSQVKTMKLFYQRYRST